MDKNQRLEELKKKQAKEIAKLELEIKITEQLPDIGFKWNVFVYNLYGSIAHCYIDHNFFAYPKDTKQITLNEVLQVARQFPPIDMVYAKGTFVSFFTLDYYELIKNQDKHNVIFDIMPFTIKVSAFQYRTYNIKWYSRIQNDIVEFSFKLPLNDLIGYFHILKRAKKSEIIENTYFYCNPDLDDFMKTNTKKVKWASADIKVPNDFTLYWNDMVQENQLIDFLEYLIEKDSNK